MTKGNFILLPVLNIPRGLNNDFRIYELFVHNREDKMYGFFILSLYLIKESIIYLNL